MRKHLLPLVSLLLAVPAVCGAGSPPAVDVKAAFDRLRGLAGIWENKSEKGPLRLTYEVISGGASVVERIVVENTTMQTVYHLDGSRLLLTHYCMLGNQPRMEAKRFDPDSGVLRFEFLDITNLASPEAPHMHDVTFHFIDSDHLAAEWQLFEGGKPKLTERYQFTRVH